MKMIKTPLNPIVWRINPFIFSLLIEFTNLSYSFCSGIFHQASESLLCMQWILYLFFIRFEQSTKIKLRNSFIIFGETFWICQSCSLHHDESNWSFSRQWVFNDMLKKKHLSIKCDLKSVLFSSLLMECAFYSILATKKLCAFQIEIDFDLFFFCFPLCKSINCEFINVHCLSIPRISEMKTSYGIGNVWFNWFTKSGCYV